MKNLTGIITTVLIILFLGWMFLGNCCEKKCEKSDTKKCDYSKCKSSEAKKECKWSSSDTDVKKIIIKCESTDSINLDSILSSFGIDSLDIDISNSETMIFISDDGKKNIKHFKSENGEKTIIIKRVIDEVSTEE